MALFDTYCQRMDNTSEKGFVKELGAEVRRRLKQLDFLLRRIGELEEVTSKALERPQAALKSHVQRIKHHGHDFECVPAPEDCKVRKEESDAYNAAEFEMELLTGSFYYLASRVRTIIKLKSAPMPKLQSFEAAKVRNVRNKLLEHAESKDSQVLIQSFAHGGKHGPVIKAIRSSDQVNIFPDDGLYVNAEEFKCNLERTIRTALEQ